MPYVNERWLGGMLTNFATISLRVRKMQEYEAMEVAGDFEAMPKREALRHRRELDKLRRNLGGFRNLDRVPDAIFVIDTKKEHIAVTEANKLGMPVVAVVDTNCDPDQVTYVIPGNDDAIRSGSLMCRVVAEAVKEGRYVAANRPVPEPRPGSAGGSGGRDGGPRRSRPTSAPIQRAPRGEPTSEPVAAQRPPRHLCRPPRRSQVPRLPRRRAPSRRHRPPNQPSQRRPSAEAPVAEASEVAPATASDICSIRHLRNRPHRQPQPTRARDGAPNEV